MKQWQPKIVLLPVLVILMVLFAAPFLHNHEPDLLHHEDCPVFILETGFNLLWVVFVAVFFGYICCGSVWSKKSNPNSLSYSYHYSPRSPPVMG
ncbi:hypothetical protein GF406_04770 [candidate division KSB1 bacterium]|jgi:hypothetical protein|nr:hypothetical protein [candidate division KSB1 bacterium]